MDFNFCFSTVLFLVFFTGLFVQCSSDSRIMSENISRNGTEEKPQRLGVKEEPSYPMVNGESAKDILPHGSSDSHIMSENISRNGTQENPQRLGVKEEQSYPLVNGESANDIIPHGSSDLHIMSENISRNGTAEKPQRLPNLTPVKEEPSYLMGNGESSKDISPHSIDKEVNATLNWSRGNEGIRTEDKIKDRTIIEGSPVNISKVPSSVLVMRKRPHHRTRCGGNLISERHVLSAAHCVISISTSSQDKPGAIKFNISKPANVRVRVGSSYADRGGRIIVAKTICVHPDHEILSNFSKVKKDIAVITLRHRVNLSSSVQIAGIHFFMKFDGLEKMENEKCWVAGWGTVRQGRLEKTTNVLKQTNVTLFSPYLCWQYYHGLVDENTEICTLDKDVDICEDDSGSGLFCGGTILALVSWGKRCTTGQPNLYTRVDNEREFIEMAMNGSSPTSNLKLPLFLFLFNFLHSIYNFIFNFLYLHPHSVRAKWIKSTYLIVTCLK